MLVPLSGPWAEQGILEQMGAEMAIDDVNNAGGIKSLGGAKLKLLVLDTGDHRRKGEERRAAHDRAGARTWWAASAAGCPTFTLAATEVTERAELPWLTLSYSDADHRSRLQVRVPVLPHRQRAGGPRSLPILMKLAEKATGKRPTKVAIIGDNTAASVSFLKPIRDARR